MFSQSVHGKMGGKVTSNAPLDMSHGRYPPTPTSRLGTYPDFSLTAKCLLSISVQVGTLPTRMVYYMISMVKLVGNRTSDPKINLPGRKSTYPDYFSTNINILLLLYWITALTVLTCSYSFHYVSINWLTKFHPVGACRFCFLKFQLWASKLKFNSSDVKIFIRCHKVKGSEIKTGSVWVRRVDRLLCDQSVQMAASYVIFWHKFTCKCVSFESLYWNIITTYKTGVR